MVDAKRLPYLDAVRVIATALLVIFHTGLIFTPFFEFVIANKEKNLGLAILTVAVLYPWHMPLLFFISGISTYFSINRRGIGQYLKERLLRLFVPFVCGIFLVVPPQVYYSMISRGQFKGNLITFYGFYLTKGISQGYFTWHHLWFIIYLFTISVVLCPILESMLHGKLRIIVKGLGNILSERSIILAGALPLVLTEILFRGKWPGYYNLVSDWANVSLFLIVFAYGFIAASDERILSYIYRRWRSALVVAVSITSVLAVIIGVIGERPSLSYHNPVYYLYTGVSALNTWCWIIGLIGLAHASLRQDSAFLRHAAQISFPFYILHQTILVAIGSYIIPLSLGIFTKFMLIVLLTFPTTIASVEILCRIAIFRFLLGVKSPLSSAPLLKRTRRAQRWKGTTFD